MERDDRGNLFVLEATMISLILLGAAYAVQGLQDSSVAQQRPRAELGRLVDDVLTVLAGLDSGNGTLLDLYLAEAFHCARDAAPSPDDCDGARSENLSIKIESYLPLGAGYAIGMGNGAGVREIYRSPVPQGEAVSSSYTFAPNWSLGFMVTEFACYDPGTDANATLLPIAHGARSWVQRANVSLGSAEIAGVRANETLAWNVTLPGATRPAAGTLLANVTGNGTFVGATSYASCSHGGHTATLHSALANTTFGLSASSAPVAQAATLRADLSALLAIPGLTVGAANVTVYEPVPARPGVADGWIQVAHVPLSGTSVRTGSWTPDATSLYGAHPALLRVSVTLGGTTLELRKATTVDVALHTGEVPVDAPYRATLQAWLPDWG